MAITISASDSAGSAARIARRGEAISGGRAGAATGTEVMREGPMPGAFDARGSRDLLERRLDHLLLAEFAATDIGDDAAVAEDVDVIAVLQFVHLGRVPEEGAALAGFGTDQLVDLELGADVDAAHRV